MKKSNKHVKTLISLLVVITTLFSPTTQLSNASSLVSYSTFQYHHRDFENHFGPENTQYIRYDNEIGKETMIRIVRLADDVVVSERKNSESEFKDLKVPQVSLENIRKFNRQYGLRSYDVDQFLINLRTNREDLINQNIDHANLYRKIDGSQDYISLKRILKSKIINSNNFRLEAFYYDPHAYYQDGEFYMDGVNVYFGSHYEFGLNFDHNTLPLKKTEYTERFYRAALSRIDDKCNFDTSEIVSIVNKNKYDYNKTLEYVKKRLESEYKNGKLKEFVDLKIYPTKPISGKIENLKYGFTIKEQSASGEDYYGKPTFEMVNFVSLFDGENFEMIKKGLEHQLWRIETKQINFLNGWVKFEKEYDQYSLETKWEH